MQFPRFEPIIPCLTLRNRILSSARTFPDLAVCCNGYQAGTGCLGKKVEEPSELSQLAIAAPSFAERSRNLSRPGDSERIGRKPSSHSQNRTTRIESALAGR